MKRARLGPIVLALAGVACAVATDAPPLTEEEIKENEEWRARRDERLRSEGGWLTLVGLHWLEPGENRFGTDPDGDLVFPEGTAPAYAGSFFLEDGAVRLVPGPAAGITIEDEPAEERVLRTDNTEGTDVMRLGDLSFHVVERSGRFGIRVKNPQSPVRLGFTGMDYFPLNGKYRVQARFVPYDEPRGVEIATVIGTPSIMNAIGVVEFELDGDTVTLEPVTSGEDRFWYIFKDGTSGKETYGAGRYLYSDREADDGTVTIDFNRAYNPPCVFTPYATCPLPPKHNWTAVRIEAGEKNYSDH